jgi:hypothetical protein
MREEKQDHRQKAEAGEDEQSVPIEHGPQLPDDMTNPALGGR